MLNVRFIILMFFTINASLYADWERAAAILETSSGSGYQQFGYSVDIGKKFAVVGAPKDNADEGAAYVFKKEADGSWTEMAELPKTLPNIAPKILYIQKFGYSVSLAEKDEHSTYTDMIAVGAPGSVVNNIGTLHQTGAVCTYLFNSVTQTWQPTEACFFKSDASNNNFGFSVALSNYVQKGSFGGTDFYFSQAKLAVGDPLDDTNATDSGAVYTYNYTGSEWSAEADIFNSAKIYEDDQFGYAVAISRNYLIVGNPYRNKETLDCFDNPGCGYTMHNDTGNIAIFQSNGTLKCYTDGRNSPLMAIDNQEFGMSVDIHYRESDDMLSFIAGEKFTTYNNDHGGVQMGLCDPNEDFLYFYVSLKEFENPGNDENEFAKSVTINDKYAVVGAPLQERFTNNVLTEETGAAVIYAFENEWKEKEMLYGNSAYAHFGASVSLTSDDTLLVGADNAEKAEVIKHLPSFNPAAVIMYLLN